MKQRLFIFYVFFATAIVISAEPPELKNPFLKLKFHAVNGTLQEAADSTGGVIRFSEERPYNLKSARRKWQFQTESDALNCTGFRTQQEADGNLLIFTYHSPIWKLETTYKLFSASPIFKRTDTWEYQGDTPFQLESCLLRFPGVRMGNAEDCTVAHPAQWPAGLTPLTRARPIRKMMAKMRMPGAVLYNQLEKKGLAVTMQSFRCDYAVTTLPRDGNALDFELECQLRTELKKGDRITTGDALLGISSGSANQVFAMLSNAWKINGFQIKSRPDWVKGSVLGCINVRGTKYSRGSDTGNFENVRMILLPRMQSLGIDLLWFNPFNDGHYGVFSYYDFIPGVGTKEELAKLTSDAHKRGIRILPDLVPHGPRPNMPFGQSILKEHPEWVSRKADGTPKIWWGSLSMDYAAPGWQNYIADVGRWYMKNFDIDGWRVDCARYSPDNERPTDGRRPYQSGTEGALRLMNTVHRAMNEEGKRDTILIGETNTTVHLSEMEFIYDNSLGALLRDLRKTPAKWFVAKLKKYFTFVQSAMSPELYAGLMHWVENHDTVSALYQYGPGHHAALLSTVFLIPGLPLVNRDQDTGFGELITRLANIRRRPEFAEGKALYAETECSELSVLAFTRKHQKAFSIAAINFSGIAQTIRLRIPNEIEFSPHAVFTDLMKETTVKRKGRILHCTLQPYSTAVFSISSDKSKATHPASAATPEETKKTALQITESSPLHCMVNGSFGHAELAAPFLVSLKDANGNLLLNGLRLVENPLPVWKERGSAFSRENFSDLKQKIVQTPAGAEIRYSGLWEHGKNRRLPFVIRYGFSNQGTIRFDLELATPSDIPFTPEAQLGVEFLLNPEAQRYFVSTMEGVFADRLERLAPLGDEFELKAKGLWPTPIRIMRLRQKSGMLYQAAAFPLDPQNGKILIDGPGIPFGFHFSNSDREKLQNIYLRQKQSDGTPAAVRLEVLDSLLPQPVPGTRLHAGCTIHLNDQRSVREKPLTGNGWKMENNGSCYTFSNSSFSIDIQRNCGGETTRFAATGKSGNLLTRAEILSDDGCFPGLKNVETGKILPAIGTNFENQEPVMQVSGSQDQLTLRFDGRLKLARTQHRWDAKPACDYQLKYQLSGKNRMKHEISVRLEASSSIRKGTICRRIRFHEVLRTEINGQSFATEEQPKNAVFFQDLPAGKLRFLYKDGTVWNINILRAEGIQDMTLERDRSGDIVWNICFFNAAKPASTTPTTGLLEYEWEILP